MQSADERAIARLHATNRAVVKPALDYAADDDGEAAAAIGRLRKRLNHKITSARLATCTGELFKIVAESTGEANTLHLVTAINERMHEFRILECQRIGKAKVARELTSICDLLLEGHTDRIQEQRHRAIDAYHDERVPLISELCGILADR